MIGLSTSGSISLGSALVAGRKRVPSPAAGNTALQTFIVIDCLQHKSEFHKALRCKFGSKRWAVISQHRLANDLQRNAALLHQPVMKFKQAEIRTAHFSIVFPQLEDLELSQCIDQIGRIGSAALRFEVCYRRRLIPLFDEELLGLLDCHLAGMHLNSDEVTCIP